MNNSINSKELIDHKQISTINKDLSQDFISSLQKECNLTVSFKKKEFTAIFSSDSKLTQFSKSLISQLLNTKKNKEFRANEINLTNLSKEKKES